MFLSVTNPATSREIKKIKIDTPEDIKQKHKNAQDALEKIRRMSFQDRVTIIKKFKRGLHHKKNELAMILSNETGKPILQSKAEIKGLMSRINFFVQSIEDKLKPKTIREANGTKECITYEPLGIIVNISAWNYPYFVGGNIFIPAILTGNCVLYKPSEFASLTGQAITTLFLESGLVEGAFQSIYGRGITGDQLLDLPVDGVFFTGSNKTGQKVCEKMKNRMVPIQLELGGKDPAYVHNDVDLSFTAKSLAGGAFYNNGQSCCAVERIYVHQAVYDQFLSLFTKIVQSYIIGDPLHEETFLGPLTRFEQIQFLEAQIHDATNKGAQIILGGKRIECEGYFFEPTILVDVDHSMNVMQNESFGPIIGIQCVKDQDEAFALMQDTSYGLTSSVYSNNQELAEEILKDLHTGSVYWNTCDRVSSHLPWSGRKGSGIGATLGLEGIRSFVRPKAWHMSFPSIHKT